MNVYCNVKAGDTNTERQENNVTKMKQKQRYTQHFIYQ
jgi:hypothetical protein